MKTTWGDAAICDAHAHLFSRDFFKVLATQKKDLPTEQPVETMVEQLGWDLPPQDNAQLAARWVEELDKHSVEKTVLIASVPGDEQSAADAVRAFPDRLWGYFMLNPLVPDAAERTEAAGDIG